MISFLGWVSVLILLFLAGIHLYWACGGKWGFEAVIPIDKNGKNLLNPKWIDSLLVAVILCAVAFLLMNWLTNASVCKVAGTQHQISSHI